jgi:hypothetical protein
VGGVLIRPEPGSMYQKQESHLKILSFFFFYLMRSLEDRSWVTPLLIT